MIRFPTTRAVLAIILTMAALLHGCDRDQPHTTAGQGPATSPGHHATTQGYDDDKFVAQPTTVATTQPIVLDDSKWEPLFKGIDHRHIVIKEPRAMHIHVVRIDLRTPGLRFFVTPPGDRETGTFNSMTVSSFVRKYKAKIAINASAFTNVVDEEGKPQKVEGLSISDGHIDSRFRHNFGSLLITKDNHARIIDGKTKPDLTGVYSAVEGFDVALKDGVFVSQKYLPLHPRSALGLDKDASHLFLLTVDGRQAFYSEGASMHDLCEIFSLLGCTDAMNLDGGGSTALVILDKDGKPRQLNSPVHRGVPGNERPVANHLGVFVDE